MRSDIQDHLDAAEAMLSDALALLRQVAEPQLKHLDPVMRDVLRGSSDAAREAFLAVMSDAVAIVTAKVSTD